MDAALYLTPTEMSLFKKLPADLQEEWRDAVIEETSKAFESEDELQKRLTDAKYENTPALEQFQTAVAKHLEKGGDMANIPFEQFPEEAIPVLMHSMGACGICAFIELALQSGKVDADGMKGLSAMSVIRHQILLQNAVLA